jgi:trimeric autotransporter adhesin
MKKLLALILPIAIGITFTFSLLPSSCEAQNISTIAGNNDGAYTGDGGPAIAAELNGPDDVILDDAGNIYIADYYNNRIREINISSGIITTIAGNGSTVYNGDGIQATSAALNGPEAIAFDKAGNLYIADLNNNRVRKVSVSTGIITTIAGNGHAGFYGDGGQATNAELYDPSGIAVDTLGNVFISDLVNDRIRLVEVTGGITTFAGNGYPGFYGDGGPASNAEFNSPAGMRMDASENLYIADYNNNRIREIDRSSLSILTVAGNGYPGFSGDGSPARLAELNNPLNIGLDKSGNLFIADEANYRVREVYASGTIKTVAGNGDGSFSGDGGPATDAELNAPNGVAVDASGAIYIADENNNRIRKVASPTGIDELKGESGEVEVYPNPSNGLFTVSLSHAVPIAIGIVSSAAVDQTIIEIYNMRGEKVIVGTLKQSRWLSGQGDNLIDLSNQPAGIYVYRVIANNGEHIGEGKLVIQK